MQLATDKAIIAGAGFDSWSYRSSFDISLPSYSPVQPVTSLFKRSTTLRFYTTFPNSRCFNCSVFCCRDWLILSSQMNIHNSFRKKLEKLSEIHSELVILQRCAASGPLNRCYKSKSYPYPEILQVRVQFFLIYPPQFTIPKECYVFWIVESYFLFDFSWYSTFTASINRGHGVRLYSHNSSRHSSYAFPRNNRLEKVFPCLIKLLPLFLLWLPVVFFSLSNLLAKIISERRSSF